MYLYPAMLVIFLYNDIPLTTVFLAHLSLSDVLVDILSRTLKGTPP